MAKANVVAIPLSGRLELRVAYVDGREQDYRSAPVDAWRAERLTGVSLVEAAATFSGIAAVAYSCALRAGHAYKARKKSTDPSELFEQWLEKVEDISVLQTEEQLAAAVAAAEEGGGAVPPGVPLPEGSPDG